jgi:hypothetical protein
MRYLYSYKVTTWNCPIIENYGQQSVFDSSTIVNGPSFKSKAVQDVHDAEEEDDSDEEEWTSGKDYPQFFIGNESWKAITESDLKSCIPCDDGSNS